MLQKAVVILKPHLETDFPCQISKILGEAKNRYEERGLVIAMMKRFTFTKEQAEEFYQEHKDKSFFPLLIEATIMGPSTVMAIMGEDAIDIIREIHGPTNPPDCRPDQLRKK
jgi:nucleoside-diphosphate kinase